MSYVPEHVVRLEQKHQGADYLLSYSDGIVVSFNPMVWDTLGDQAVQRCENMGRTANGLRRDNLRIVGSVTYGPKGYLYVEAAS